MSSHGGGGNRSLIDVMQEFSIPLLSGVVTALIWANLDHRGYEVAMHWSPFNLLGDGHHSPINLHFFANELLMVFFFGVAAKEITEACLPGGALNPPTKAVNPLMGTLGGVIGPVGCYFAMVSLLGAPEIRNGWGIPTATDIALAWLVARLVFGSRHPAVSYLLLLAVADDAIGLGIIAVFYPDPENPTDPRWLALVGVALLIALALRRRNVKSFWPYLLGPGVISWAGLYFAHLHPSLALVPVVPFMPHQGFDEGIFSERLSAKHRVDTLNRFEHAFKRPVDFGLFAFGLANAGVSFSSVGPATWAVLVALVVGKTVGITGFSLVAQALGFKLPQGMDIKSLALAGLVAAIGLTVALFVAGVAFTDPTLQGSAKMGALISSVAAPLALLLGRMLGIERKAEEGPQSQAAPSSPARSNEPSPSQAE